jgi:heme A synthase
MQNPDNNLEKPGLVERLGHIGVWGATLYAAFWVWVGSNLMLIPMKVFRYELLKDIHFWVSRVMLGAAGVMLVIAVVVGLIQREDVTPWFRRLVFTVLAFMVAQAALGGTMWLMDGRPGQDVHLIYGFAAVVSLPFFMFVEMTSPKRPVMGSYIWGFFLLVGILIRCIMTGPLV